MSEDKNQFDVKHEGDQCTVRVSGAINENIDFTQVDVKSPKVLYLDLKDVKSLNSMGLRNWVLWVKEIKRTTQIVFRNCPHCVVDQMNILSGFLPMGAVVESFYVPYTCLSCSFEHKHLAVRGKDYMEGTVDTKEGAALPQSRQCPECKEKMEIDVVAAKYFHFLKYRRV